jgi:hypothetical protein
VAFLTRKWAKEHEYRLIKAFGRSMVTASRCGFSTNGITMPVSGIVPMATSNGNSTNTA